MADCPFIIRKAEAADAPAIRDIMQVAFGKYMEVVGLTGSMEALQETVEDIVEAIKTQEVFVAIADHIIVGTLRIKLLPDNTAYLSRFGVRPDYHNLGIGKKMMDTVDKFLISRGIKSVSLHTASKYSDLIRFYYSRGFYIDSTSKDRGYVRALMIKEYS